MSKRNSNETKTTSVKKSKTTKSSSSKSDNELINTIWKHYCNYFFHDNDEEDDDEFIQETDGDIDELLEIIDLIQQTIPDAFNDVFDISSLTTTTKTTITRRNLLPLLISVTSTLLADACIADYMQLEQQQQVEVKVQGDHHHQQQHELLTTIRIHLLRAIQTFPNNAAAIQMATNYIRMTKSTNSTITVSSSSKSSTTIALRPIVAKLYEYAANVACTIRTNAISFIHSNDNNNNIISNNNNDVQEWIVALLLNQVCGVDEVDDDDDDDEEDDEDEDVENDNDQHDIINNDNSNNNNNNNNNENNNENNSIIWSSSKVEGISRYMSAMMYSILQQHDLAKQQLQLLHITHRLHPKLWNMAMKASSTTSNDDDNNTLTSITKDNNNNNNTSQSNTMHPVSFRTNQQQQEPSSNIGNGVIPNHLYERLCTIFHPNSNYWYESNYASRGYFSFYMDIPPELSSSSNNNNNNTYTPRNIIDDIVCNYLLPLVQKQQVESNKNNTNKTIVGYEWWVHTRPMSSNLGHNLHFDTDEFALHNDGSISHPYISSVLYLTGGSTSTGSSSSCQGGTTIILDQTPNSVNNADRAWYSHPINNTFMIFPGNLLHGVLPCFDNTATATTVDENISTTNINDDVSLLNTLIDLLSSNENTTSIDESKQQKQQNRLTLMIGFWTRNVVKDIDQSLLLSYEDRLYGPCSPLPSIHDTKWVQELCKGYMNNNGTTNSDIDTTITANIKYNNQNNIITVPLPCVTPAWEVISTLPETSTATATNIIDSNSTNQTTTSTTTMDVLPLTQTSSLLCIPPDIDHRFFVINAPNCFQQQLIQGANIYM